MLNPTENAPGCATRNSLLMALCDHASEALFLLDPQQHCVFMNSAAEALIGFSLDELRGRPLHDVAFHGVSEEAHRSSRSEPVERDFPVSSGMAERGVVLHRDGELHPVTYTARPVHEEGHVVGTVLEVRRTRGQGQAIEALEEETRILETLHRTGAMLASKLDLEEIVQAVTEAATTLSGARFGAFFYNVIRDGKALQLYTLCGAPREAFAAFPQPRHTAVFGPTFAEGVVIRSDNIRRDPRYGLNAPYQGMPPKHLPVTSYLSVPVKACNGTIHGALIFGHGDAGVFTERSERIVTAIAAQASVAIDNAALFEAAQQEIAERQKVEAHQKLLIEELNHRVKNMLATVQSIAKRTLRGRADQIAMETFQNRLLALSQSHSLIMRENWRPVDLRELARTALAPFLNAVTGAERVQLDGPDIRLAPKVALALGMGFHELVANAVRHGALRSEQGRIEIRWREMDDNTLHLSWAEQEGPPIDVVQGQGFGLQLLEKGLAHELGGEVRLDLARSGMRCEISLPDPAKYL
jgi:PAS domain S-box-containing protein